MKDREKVSKLSKLLEDAEEQVRRCDELNPWGGTETRGAFREVSAGGALLITKLHQIDQNIMVKSRRLKSPSQLDLDNLLKLKPPPTDKTLTRWLRTWGQMLEVTEDLRDAAKFCASLAEKEKTWLRGQDYRIKFKECSQKLAGYLLYDLLDVLAEYDPEEYSYLRLQVLCSYLRELRVEFLWDARARGPCRTDAIPSKCKFGKLPDDLRGRLTVSHRENRHKFAFCTDTGQEFESLIDNTGLRNYRALLDDIWDVITGKLHSYPGDGSAVWAVPDRECIRNLEAYAALISKLLRPLSAVPDYGEFVRAIRAILRSGRGPLTKRSHIKWSYLDDLDKIIASLDSKPKQYELEV